MRFLQSSKNQQSIRSSGGDGDLGPVDQLQQARSEADRMLAAGDEAIARALAGSNAEAFLRVSKQQGGE